MASTYASARAASTSSSVSVAGRSRPASPVRSHSASTGSPTSSPLLLRTYAVLVVLVTALLIWRLPVSLSVVVQKSLLAAIVLGVIAAILLCLTIVTATLLWHGRQHARTLTLLSLIIATMLVLMTEVQDVLYTVAAGYALIVVSIALALLTLLYALNKDVRLFIEGT